MTRSLTFIAQDESRKVFPLPKHASPHLLLRAVDRVAQRGDAALATFGLTLRETEVVAEIVAWLREHVRAPQSGAPSPAEPAASFSVEGK